MNRRYFNLFQLISLTENILLTASHASARRDDAKIASVAWPPRPLSGDKHVSVFQKANSKNARF